MPSLQRLNRSVSGEPRQQQRANPPLPTIDVNSKDIIIIITVHVQTPSSSPLHPRLYSGLPA
jgi:hypothetical protein